MPRATLVAIDRNGWSRCVGISGRDRRNAHAFGRLRGGLALTVVLIGILLAASTGIVGASVVLLATLSIPIMMRQKYSRELASGVVAASGTLGILIPPSIMLVIMADQLSLSVGDLFMGAMIRGLMLGAFYVIYVLAIAQVRPDLAPAPPKTEKLTMREVWGVVLAVIPTLFLIIAVLGTIFFGIATPTEAAGVGAFGATLLAAANKRLDLATIRQVGIETTLTTAFIFGIFIGATAFALVVAGARLPPRIACVQIVRISRHPGPPQQGLPLECFVR
jgi:tripartite ATP-independent transporter DctM subunit